MIKEFDKQNLTNLLRDLDSALLTIRQKYGVSIKVGTFRHDSFTGNAKLTITAIGDANIATDPRAAALAKAQIDFNSYASSFGLKPEQFGATFTFGRETYKLAGIKPAAHKRPILGTSIRDGKTYVFPESVIAPLQSKEHKHLFGIEDAPATDGSVICSNTNAFDEKFKSIGKCNRPATTSRKSGFGKFARTAPYCDQCARLIDESRAEAEAEARCS